MVYIIFGGLRKKMDFITITAIALGLSFDTFAVSLSYGVVNFRIPFKQAVRIAFVLAFFQGGLTVTGYFLGSVLSSALKSVDHWIALGLLGFLGIKMLFEGLKKGESKAPVDYTNSLILVTMAISTSIDAFTVGISFALLDVKIWIAGFIIASVTFLASMIAIRIGKSTGERLGHRVEVAGGLILIAIGIKIFVEHILAG